MHQKSVHYHIKAFPFLHLRHTASKLLVTNSFIVQMSGLAWSFSNIKAFKLLWYLKYVLYIQFCSGGGEPKKPCLSKNTSKINCTVTTWVPTRYTMSHSHRVDIKVAQIHSFVVLWQVSLGERTVTTLSLPYHNIVTIWEIGSVRGEEDKSAKEILHAMWRI